MSTVHSVQTINYSTYSSNFTSFITQ